LQADSYWKVTQQEDPELRQSKPCHDVWQCVGGQDGVKCGNCTPTISVYDLASALKKIQSFRILFLLVGKMNKRRKVRKECA